MKKVVLLLVVAGAAAAAVAVALARGPAPQAGNASSHREAPLISEDPSADNTDLYAFRSPDKPDTFTIVSNWIPGEDPAAGPNYYTFSPSARYNIYIDQNGDGKPDVTFRFRFQRKPGQFFLGDTVQPYTVTKIVGHKSSVVANGTTPPDNIGPRTTPNYHALAQAGIFALDGGGSVFAGQRDDPFFGDIGAIFDLLAIRKGIGNAGGGKDFFAGYAVHSIALQLPIADYDTTSHVIGVWSTTDRQVVQVEQKKVKVKGKTRVQVSKKNAWQQVSRLGNPLINEAVIPTDKKDLWNRLTPATDKQFEQYYSSPILAAVINKLYNLGVKETDRSDLVAVLLTGLKTPNLNYTGPTLADELRLNLSIPPTAPDKVNRMGVLGGDLAGYPNGRRLEDDVIDITEQAVAGALIGTNIPLGDGVNADDKGYLGSFPYANDPNAGFDNTKGEQKP
jgi:Domain of unknown function (DUF4331)